MNCLFVNCELFIWINIFGIIIIIIIPNLYNIGIRFSNWSGMIWRNWRERKSVVDYVNSIEGRFSCWLFLSDWIEEHRDEWIDDELIIENDHVREGLERWSVLFVVVAFGIFIIFVEDFTCFFGCRWSSHCSIRLLELVKSICWRLGKETIVECLPTSDLFIS
jgi:hypothetical protein